jgi:hypothetical protein
LIKAPSRLRVVQFLSSCFVSGYNDHFTLPRESRAEARRGANQFTKVQCYTREKPPSRPLPRPTSPAARWRWQNRTTSEGEVPQRPTLAAHTVQSSDRLDLARTFVARHQVASCVRVLSLGTNRCVIPTGLSHQQPVRSAHHDDASELVGFDPRSNAILASFPTETKLRENQMLVGRSPAISTYLDKMQR